MNCPDHVLIFPSDKEVCIKIYDYFYEAVSQTIKLFYRNSKSFLLANLRQFSLFFSQILLNGYNYHIKIIKKNLMSSLLTIKPSHQIFLDYITFISILFKTTKLDSFRAGQIVHLHGFFFTSFFHNFCLITVKFFLDTTFLILCYIQKLKTHH